MMTGSLMPEPTDVQLDRIEAKLDKVQSHLSRLNGQVARNTQGMWGVDGRGGLRDEVHSLSSVVERWTPGMTSTKTVWAAVAALASIAAVSLTLGLS